WTVLLHVYFSIDVRQKEEVYPLSWVRLLFLVLSFNLYMVKKKKSVLSSNRGYLRTWNVSTMGFRGIFEPILYDLKNS
ncbi:hypothetical protein CBF51_06185, partial [Lactobacillus taiwanensis]